MRRREFIALLGSSVAVWPLDARAQQRERVRRVGVLMPFTADDPEGQARLLAFAQGLQQMGWAVGSNLRIDARWGAADAERNRKYAAELLALAQTLSWLMALRSCGRSYRQRTICRSCSRTCLIPWLKASSRA